ncbi:MAG: hypothetical protein GF346_09620 [Candidatus Eisenbacteria bacterium]|nr:hypothetical protein [Candidatus Latescibacterota bacterium]MBD3302691.1 hypothetical protein [Candidatus Eisenbacteria bacterium]
MYRLNFYREYGEKRRRKRLRTVWIGVLACIVGLEFLFAISLLVSSVLLDEQAARLDQEIDQLNRSLAQRQPVDSSTEIQVARELALIRAQRIDWAPKLTAISERIDPDLRLERIIGQVGQRNGPPRFALTGVASASGSDMELVNRFMKSLRKESRITIDLPDVRLETLKGDGTGQFEIVCEKRLGET